MIVVVIMIQFVSCYIAYKVLQSFMLRISLLCINVAFFMYSCFGIAYYNLSEKYYYVYIGCMITLNICYIVGTMILNRISRAIIVNEKTYMSPSDYTIQRSAFYLKWLTVLYFVIRFLWLLYPEFNLKYIFAVPNFIYKNTLEATSDSIADPVGKLFSTLTTILLPFVLIYLFRERNKKNVIVFSLVDTYIQYLMGRASVGRLVIIKNIIVICLVFYFTEKNKNKRRRYIFLLFFASLLCIIIYLLLENWRNGVNTSIFDISIKDAIDHFVDSEFYYPKHYPLASELYLQGAFDSKVFWLWLITLPVPKLLFSIPVVDSYRSIIYRVFTYFYWGGHWGNESGYAGMLLSSMGDGIFVYGERFAFILFIPLGLFIGYYLCYLNRIKNSEIVFCYTVFNFVVSFRPGVQYALQHINTLVGIIIVIFGLRIINGELYSSKNSKKGAIRL